MLSIQLRATHIRALALSALALILLCTWTYTSDFRQPVRPITPPPYVEPVSNAAALSQPATELPSAAPLPQPPAQLPQPRNTIVMAATKSDHTDWVAKELSDWDAAIYSVDNDTTRELHTPANKGKESMAYLTYIIDNYENLPNISIFLHSHRDGYPAAWHTDNNKHSNPWSVKHLQLSAVETRGFINLRCNHVPGCPAEIQPFRNPPEGHRDLEHAFERIWKEIFGADQQVPRRIGTPCCAQFAVTKEAVRKRTKEDWVGYRKWLLNTKEDDEMSGRVFEYLWHILFGREEVMCKKYNDCYCEVYGMLCDERD